MKINSEVKIKKYKEVQRDARSLLSDESDLIANLANISALLKDKFQFFWVGFYLVKKNELVLGPFQGPIACTRITLGRGVCGSAWLRRGSIIVPNVSLFEGHIACSPYSKSEIVIPLLKENKVVGVLDIDSNELNTFSEIDLYYLENICQLIVQYNTF